MVGALSLLWEAGARSGTQRHTVFAFYEPAPRAFAVVATSETALYANLILKKGVVVEE